MATTRYITTITHLLDLTAYAGEFVADFDAAAGSLR